MVRRLRDSLTTGISTVSTVPELPLPSCTSITGLIEQPRLAYGTGVVEMVKELLPVAQQLQHAEPSTILHIWSEAAKIVADLYSKE